MAEALHIAWYERGVRYRLAGPLVGALAVSTAIILAYDSPTASLTGPFAAAAVAGIAIWMLTSAKTHVTLAMLMLYLALADGVIKLMTNSSTTTLGRDLLLYAIVIGLVVKRILRKEPFVSPPFSGWIVAFVAVIAVEVFNPGDKSIYHALASTRPHLEFIPLFFLGYSVMQSRRRLRGFLLLLIVVTAINGMVGLVQFGMSPSQLASWGPGYAARINGTSGVSPRGFVDSTGKAHTRPFALGSDQGFGGSLGLIAAPAVLALLSLGGDRRVKIAVGALSIGVVMAIVTSQARVAVLASVVGILAYLVLATSSRRAFRVLLGLGLGLMIGYAAVSVLAASTSSHLFDRYSSITPGKALSTAYNYRSGTIAQVPEYMAKFPLGAGIGSTGPAADEAGGTGNSGLDAESEPTFLLIELGIAGFLVLTAFQVRFMALSFKIRRFTDVELRLLLAALAAPLFAIFASGFAGITTAATPEAPYLWFASGVLAYWLVGRRALPGNAANRS